MNDKIRNITVTVVFVLFMAFFVAFCANGFVNPVEKSESERRPNTRKNFSVVP